MKKGNSINKLQKIIGAVIWGRLLLLPVALMLLLEGCIHVPPSNKTESTLAFQPDTQTLTTQARLMTQLGHSNWITSVVYSPDGRKVLTGSLDHTVILWDVATGLELRRFEGHSDAVRVVAFDPKGDTIASSSDDGTSRLWSVVSGQELRRFEGHSGHVSEIAFGPDGRTVLTISNLDNTARLWDVNNGQELSRFEGHSANIFAGAFTPDGPTVLTVDWPDAKLWNITTGQELQRFAGFNSHGVSIVKFSHDRNTIISHSDNGTIRLWEVLTGLNLRSFIVHPRIGGAMAVSPDGHSIMIGSNDGTSQLWDLMACRNLRSFEGLRGYVSAVAFAPNGQTVIAASEDGTSKLWSVENGQELQQFNGYSNPVRSIAFSPDGHLALTGTVVGSRLWDLEKGREERSIRLHLSYASSVAFTADSRIAVASGIDETDSRFKVLSWDVTANQKMWNFDGSLVTDIPQWATISRDSSKVLISSGDDIRILDRTTGRELQQLKGHSGYVGAVAFAPNNRSVLIGSRKEAIVRLWDLSTGSEQWRIEGASAEVSIMAFSPDGRSVLTGNWDGALLLRDALTGRELRSFERQSHRVTAIAFSPDGGSVLTGNWDGTILLWDAATGQKLRNFEGGPAYVSAVAFAPDGRLALTGSLDGTSRLWSVNTGEELAQLISFRDGNWAVVDRTGRFDGSNGGDIQGLHWVIGLEPIALSQLKERYYEPGLLAKKLGFNPEPLRDVAAFTAPKLYPEVEVAPVDPSDPMLNITLKNRGGGIGRVVVAINGKEAQYDARDATTDPEADSLMLKVPLASPPYLLTGQKNVVEVRAYNTEGYLSSRGTLVEFQAPGETSIEKPTLWAVVAGVSDYKGDSIDLRYAAKDAQDIAQALTLGAQRLFGVERVKLFLLSTALTDGAIAPTKAEFRKAFQEMEAAKPQDILMVYLSGHGVTFRDNYYYLTQDARQADLTDPEVRNLRGSLFRRDSRLDPQSTGIKAGHGARYVCSRKY